MVASSDLEMPLLAIENELGILDSWFSVTHAVCVLIHRLLEPLASLPSVYWEAMQHLSICVPLSWTPSGPNKLLLLLYHF